MNILQHILKDILVKFKDEKIPNDLKNINLERKNYNNELNNLLKSDNLIIEKYYKLQSGGAVRQTFDATTIAQLENLNNILKALGSISPGQINDKTQKIKDITQKIIDEINQISSTDIDVNKLFDKIPQILNTAQININSTTKGFKIGSELANLTIPLDISGVQYDANGKITGDFINSKKLNEMMSRMKQSYDSLNTSISSGISVNDTEFSRVKSEIEINIRILNEQKTKLETINTELTKKITDFDKIHNDIRIDINDLKFKDIHQTAKDVEQYINNNPTPEDKAIMEKVIKFAYKSNTTNIESDRNLFIKNNEVEFAKQYNENINRLSTLYYTVGSNTKKLPDKCYRGSDTKAIANNILNESISNTTNLMESVKSLLNSNIEDFKEPSGLNVPNRFKTEKFEQIYKPQFGGDIDEIKNLLKDLNETSVGYRTVYKQFVKLTEMYNKYAIYELMHSIYLLSILSNSLFAKGGYQVYKYIGRGMVNFYKRIIEKIFKELQRDKSTFIVPDPTNIDAVKASEESQLLLLEIRKKYYLTILILKKFLNELSQKLTPNDIIDIDECDDKVLQYFTLLNHFKTILEKYNETQMNKLTIFSRINDIGMNVDRKNKDRNGEMLNLDLKQYNNIDQSNYNQSGNISDPNSYDERLQYNIDNKLFISDYLRRNIYTGYYIKNIPYENNNNPFDLTKNNLLKLELKRFELNITNNPYDSSDKEHSGTNKNNIATIEIYKFYEKVREIFNDTTLQKLQKIEKIEAYKKDIISVKIGDIFNQEKLKQDNLQSIENEIIKLETDIEDVKNQIADYFSTDTLTDDAKQKNIKEIRDNNLSTKTNRLEQKLMDKNTEKNTYNPDDINSKMGDIKKIIYLVKLALEELCATNNEISEKLMWIRNETCDAQKPSGCTDPQDTPYVVTNANSPKICTLPSDLPYLNSYKFTEVFDTQNFLNNADMSNYMCLNSRLTSGNGVALITYGYSGTGKSYTLFGNSSKEGLLQGTLSKLDGIDKVYFRTFEIYGKGLPYVDYWYKVDSSGKQETKMDKIYNYLYAYKLQKDITLQEKIRVVEPLTEPKNKPMSGKTEWAVELYGNEIEDYIKQIENLRENRDYKYKKTTSDGKEDILDYLELDNREYKDIFSEFSIFTDKIEKMRIETQRVRETPNNKVSSRSILIYDFLIKINKDGNLIPVNFLIIDLPGREEIAPTFIKKYVDEIENPVMYNLIKNGFTSDNFANTFITRELYKKTKGLPNIDDITSLSGNEIDIPDIYMKELKAMLSAFTLNPLAVPIFACEVIEEYIKNNFSKLKDTIINKELDRHYILNGEINNVFKGHNLEIKKKFKLLDEFYYENFSEKLFSKDPSVYKLKDDKEPIEFLIMSKIFLDSGLGWYTFNNLCEFNSDGSLEIYGKEVTNINKNVDKTLINDTQNVKKINFPSTPTELKNTVSARIGPLYNFIYGIDNDKHKGRQIKILLFRNFIKRIIELQEYAILNELFEMIVDNKINYYIKKSIDIRKSNNTLQDLITDLIDANFKRDALREKFYDNNQIKNLNAPIKIKEDQLYKTGDKQYTKDVEITINDTTEYLFNSIKYDFYTTGFEGIYINENIIGLIKYLGKDGKPIKDSSGNILLNTDGTPKLKYLINSLSDRDMIEINKQNKEYDFNKGMRLTNLVSLSRMKFEGKDVSLDFVSTDLSIEDYAKTVLHKINPTGNPLPSISNIPPRNAQTTASGNSTVPEWQKNLASSKKVKASNKKEGSNIPSAFIYNRNTKLKLLHINNQDYIEQLFIKTNTTPDSKQEAIINNYDGMDPKIIYPISKYEDYFYNPYALDRFYEVTLEKYKSSNIFCYDSPIIKSILEKYLDLIDDFKIFYLFGNYEKAVRELKCKQQYELLETTNNFIEAITR